ncbi:hypothetical protein D3C75_1120320 [compost metagenome]
MVHKLAEEHVQRPERRIEDCLPDHRYRDKRCDMREEECRSVDRHSFHFPVDKQGQGQGCNDDEQTGAKGVDKRIL